MYKFVHLDFDDFVSILFCLCQLLFKFFPRISLNPFTAKGFRQNHAPSNSLKKIKKRRRLFDRTNAPSNSFPVSLFPSHTCTLFFLFSFFFFSFSFFLLFVFDIFSSVSLVLVKNEVWYYVSL
jgi:hypothetical protein